jgi:hypothetical protein
MPPRRPYFRRLCTTVLLTLIVSPLTAPFSAGHPLDLLGGAAAHVQSKKAPDDPVVSIGVAPVVMGESTLAPMAAVVPLRARATSPHTHALPLRL